MSTEFHEGVVTIMFTDVEGSTDLTARHGDEAGQRIIDLQRRVVREEVDRHSGREGDSIGDGFMITFASTRRAVLCAIAIQRALEEHGEQHPDERVRLRIGLNIGEVISQAGHPFGGAVNAAARVAGHARGGEILVAEAVRQVAGTMPGVSTRDRGRFQLKGFPERWRLYEVVWQPGATEVREPAGRLRLPRRRLHRAGLAALVALVLGGAAAGAVLALTGGEDGERAGGSGNGRSSLPTPANDPPDILPGRSIGGIELGMREGEVVERYGEPEITRDYSSSGRTGAIASYPVREGRLRVAYFGDDVVAVSTTSDYYSMADGTKVGVASPSPLADAPAVERVGGEFVWREYTFENPGRDCTLWATRGFGAVTELVFRFSAGSGGSVAGAGGRITGIRIAKEGFTELPRELGLCR
jgi:class 3 adenylate cyclase